MGSLLLAAAAAMSVVSLSLPAHTLDGDAKTFPQDAEAPRSIFVVTFTKAASEQGRAWTQRLGDLHERLTAPVFQVSVIEDVPKMFRSSVISGMGHSVPKELHGRFWTAVSDSEKWKSVTASASPKEASVIVVDRRGEIVWRGHGEVTDAKIEEIAGLPAPHL